MGYFTGSNANTENEPQITDQPMEDPLCDKTIEGGEWIMVDEESNASGRSSPVFVAEPKIDSMPDSADDTDDVTMASLSQETSSRQSFTAAGPLTRSKQLKSRNDKQTVAHIMFSSDPMTASRVFQQTCSTKSQGSASVVNTTARVKRHNITQQQPVAVKAKSRKNRAKAQLHSGANNDRRCQKNYWIQFGPEINQFTKWV